MKFLITLTTALVFLTGASASPTPIDSGSASLENQVEKRAGPSGTLLSPAGGYRDVLNGGVIPVVYKTVHTSTTGTYAIDVTLIRKSHGYSHVLASFLTGSGNSQNIVATFRIPRDIVTTGGGFGTDYQVQIREYQTNPGDTSQLDSVPPFISAAPYISISYAG